MLGPNSLVGHIALLLCICVSLKSQQSFWDSPMSLTKLSIFLCRQQMTQKSKGFAVRYKVFLLVFGVPSLKISLIKAYAGGYIIRLFDY